MTDTATAEAPAEPAMPTNVVQAIARVMAEIGGIQKMTPQQRAKAGMGGGGEGINYAYRGIDQICAQAQPLMGRFGVVTVPDVERIDLKQVEVGRNGALWDHYTIRVTWHVFGPGGVEDRLPAITTVGEGRDNSDKGINKGMTTAYKNLLLRLLCIGDPKDDVDNERTENADRAPKGPQPLTDYVWEKFGEKCAEFGLVTDEVLAAAFPDGRPDPVTDEHLPAMRDALTRLRSGVSPTPEAPASPEAVEPAESAASDGPPPSAPSSQPEHEVERAADDMGMTPEQAAEQPRAAVRPASRAQVGKIKGEYGRLGVEDRTTQLSRTADVIGRAVNTHGELTIDEAKKLIEHLTSLQPEPQPEAEQSGDPTT